MPAEKPLTEAQARALASRLRRLREEAGLTQEQVAHGAGISRNHYQLLERGLSDRLHGSPSNPRLSTLISLSAVLQTTVPELLVDIFPARTDNAVEYRHAQPGGSAPTSPAAPPRGSGRTA